MSIIAVTRPSSEWINSTSSLITLIDKLSGLPTTLPSLYIDLEGVNLSRNGTISIFQLFVPHHHSIYLIDIYTLGERAFDTASTTGQTLKQILEAPSIPKVIFDVRKDSDALYAHYHIKLAGVQDLQLMEFATRTSRGQYVNSLSRCIERDARLPAEETAQWIAMKDRGRNLFDPQRGGNYGVFNIRPLPEEVRTYCVQDVLYMPRLWDRYSMRLTEHWRARVEAATQDRIALSLSANFNGNGPHMALGPRELR